MCDVTYVMRFFFRTHFVALGRGRKMRAVHSKLVDLPAREVVEIEGTGNAFRIKIAYSG